MARATAEVQNRVMYAADGANESTSSEVNLLTAAAAAIAPPTPRKTTPRKAAARKPAARKPAARKSTTTRATARKRAVTAPSSSTTKPS